MDDETKKPQDCVSDTLEETRLIQEKPKATLFWHAYIFELKKTRNDEGHRHAKLIVRWGSTKEGAKIQSKESIFDKGKNISKKNETSPLDQARVKMNFDSEKKKRKGYFDPDADEDEYAEVRNRPQPMLAKDYFTDRTRFLDKDGTYMVAVQRKVDGVRATYSLKTLTGYFRSGVKDAIDSVPHVSEAIEKLRDELDLDPDWWLDGELCSDTLDFDTACGIIRSSPGSKNHNPEKAKSIKLYVFDMIAPGNYTERCRPILGDGSTENDGEIPDLEGITDGVIVPVPYYLRPYEKGTYDSIRDFYDDMIDRGEEGIMVRLLNHEYKSGKVSILMKHKYFTDSEFLCIRVIPQKNKTGEATCGALEFVYEPDDVRAERAARLEGASKKVYREESRRVTKLMKMYTSNDVAGVPKFHGGAGSGTPSFLKSHAFDSESISSSMPLPEGSESEEETPPYETFKAAVSSGKGTRELNKYIWKNPDEYIGRYITVKYVPLPNRLPRHPNVLGLKAEERN